MYSQNEKSVAQGLEELFSRGWVKIQNVVDQTLVRQISNELDAALIKCSEEMTKAGIIGTTEGTVHHLPVFGGAFVEFLKKMYLHREVSAYFNPSKYILNSYGGVLNTNSSNPYVRNIHRDLRTFSTERLMLNILVMIDDFTLENGATYVLDGSHNCPNRPEDSMFYKNSSRITGLKGDIVLFDSNLWHAAGENTTSATRRCLTITVTKPFYKPQFDYCSTLSEQQIKSLPEEVLQLFGYYSRIPASLSQYYQPKESRFYRSNQE